MDIGCERQTADALVLVMDRKIAGREKQRVEIPGTQQTFPLQADNRLIIHDFDEILFHHVVNQQRQIAFYFGEFRNFGILNLVFAKLRKNGVPVQVGIKYFLINVHYLADFWMNESING
ncbi:hypothetical protein SDC9_119965 [bioreactor metagenome]|uniref:Uncharacterized protein n=1 Tax=bioreactor metagenome TaxID=1076179 RepID=A0A645C5S6_9ZZZZ